MNWWEDLTCTFDWFMHNLFFLFVEILKANLYTVEIIRGFNFLSFNFREPVRLQKNIKKRLKSKILLLKFINKILYNLKRMIYWLLFVKNISLVFTFLSEKLFLTNREISLRSKFENFDQYSENHFEAYESYSKFTIDVFGILV